MFFRVKLQAAGFCFGQENNRRTRFSKGAASPWFHVHTHPIFVGFFSLLLQETGFSFNEDSSEFASCERK